MEQKKQESMKKKQTESTSIESDKKHEIQSVMQQQKQIMEEAKRDFEAELEKLNQNEIDARFKLCLAHIEVLYLGNETLRNVISNILNGKT